MKTHAPFAATLLLAILLSANAHAEDWDAQLRDAGYVDLQTFIPGLRVELKYATADNFMHRPVYHGLTRAFLHPDAAHKLRRAHELLRRERPDLTLLVYDAARPIAVQRIMWSLVRGTRNTYYVANPTRGGLHNFGLAVDLTLADTLGHALPMGTPFDHFGPAANTDREQQLVRTGRITRQELQNRLLLRRIMRAAGFTTVTSEWWHFNACPAARARASYPLIGQ